MSVTIRAAMLVYLHDCCQIIYFASTPSFDPIEIEMEFRLPCEDILWTAKTSTEWFMALQQPSAFGSIQERLVGIKMSQGMVPMREMRLAASPMLLEPCAHFVLIHQILRHLFDVCIQKRQLKTEDQAVSMANPSGPANDELDPDIVGLQYALHNWLQSWLNYPDVPRITRDTEPLFLEHCLPFYWLGQIALMAYQEGLPPFERNSPNNMNEEARFHIIKRWLKRIRSWLMSDDDVLTRFWDEMMKMRLRTWQTEENEKGEQQEGLLEFFTECS